MTRRAVTHGRHGGGLARALVRRTALFTLVWWAVAEGSGHGWGLGVVAVALAVLTSMLLGGAEASGPGPPVRLRAVPRFAAWFVARSAAGGVDVALRALRRPVDVDPGEVEVPLWVPTGWPRVLVADVLSVLPGTLAVESRGDVLAVHVLDRRAPVRVEAARLQAAVARLCGAELPVGPGPDA